MDYDVLVIGTGTGAAAVVKRLAAAGRSVAVVDHRPFGGTCALRGCDPKKALVAGAEAIDLARHMQGHGVAGSARIEWPELIRFKRSFTDPIPAAREAEFAKAGIETLHGRARFVGPDAIAAGERTFTAERIVLASGAEPAPLGIPGAELLATSEDFMALARLPARVLLVGGGYIAAEFSHIAARAGAEVTVLQRAPRLLTGFEPELVGWLMGAFAALGVDVRLNCEVKAIERRGEAFAVAATENGASRSYEADLVVHAAGRRPALGDLDLEAGGVATGDGRLRLNAFLQSRTNPAVYAVGDAAQCGPPLTPVSARDGAAAAANILDGNHVRPDYRGVPRVAFTQPPIASVGLGEAEARRQGLKFACKLERTSGWFTARRVAEPVYGYKSLVEEGSGRILGAHLVGPDAEDTINLFALAIRHGLTADDLKSAAFAYPTAASDIDSML